MIASDGSGGETSHADPAIGKVKPEEALRVAKSLRSRDRVTQILDDVQDLSLLGSFSGLHLSLPLLLAFLGTISLLLVCFVDKKLALLLRCLVELDESDKNGQPDADQPALACTSRHCFEIPSLDEFDLDEDGQVIEEPIEQESKSAQNLKVLFQIRKLSTLDLHDLDVFVEGLEETEELSRRAHVLCQTSTWKFRYEVSTSLLQ